MLEIHIPDSFFEEREYVIQVILRDFLGLSFRIVPNRNFRDYEIVLENGNKIVIEDHFFGRLRQGGDYLLEDIIPENVEFASNDFTSESDVPVIYGRSYLEESRSGSAKCLVCGIDIFSSSFFMLTRWEEYVVKMRDQHNRFPAKASLAHRKNFLHRPVVNEYVEMFWNMFRFLDFRQERKRHDFRLFLTHDVDIPLFWKDWSQIGYLVGGDLLKRRNPVLAARNLWRYFSAKTGITNDPYDTFGHMMDCAEALETKSHFFFMGGSRTPLDGKYKLNSRFIRQLMKRIDRRNHMIGFHPSYLTYDRSDLWEEEFAAVSEVSPQPVRTGRQHVLRFEIPTTWQIWDDNHMMEDMSMGYADHEGFRCGVCWAYPVFNIFTRKQLNLKERPLLLMDGTLVSYLELSPEEMEDRIWRLREKVRYYNGDFVLVWHNTSFYGDPWGKYGAVYRKFISKSFGRNDLPR